MSTIKMLEVGLSNMFIVEDEKTMIIDTGCGLSSEEYKAKISSLVKDPNQVSLIVLTHGHFDHCARLDELKELFPKALVLAHKDAVHFLETGEFLPYVPRNEDGEKFLVIASSGTVELPSPTTPDVVVGDEDFDLLPYGIHGKIVYSPGHVSSNISVVLESGEAFVGDSIMGNPFNDGKITLALFCDDKEALRKSLGRLVKEATSFYSGHSAGPFTREEVHTELDKL